ncbi:MAG: hypothetical protein IPP40_01040 [bacterium]|nr:hypothetical protein [bacterium]
MNTVEIKKNGSPKQFNPAYALVEVMMHELANPVQAARTTLHLLRSEPLSATDAMSRVQGLETALERVAIVIRNVQAVKDSSLIPPASVSSDRLLTEIVAECTAVNLKANVSAWPEQPVILKLHGAAIPILVSHWAAGARAEQQILNLSLIPIHDGWTLSARLRDGEGAVISKESTAIAVAGYPAAIGEFMYCAGGSAFVKEDNIGTFEIALNIATWT